jgi:hypothetical protein
MASKTGWLLLVNAPSGVRMWIEKDRPTAVLTAEGLVKAGVEKERMDLFRLSYVDKRLYVQRKEISYGNV